MAIVCVAGVARSAADSLAMPPTAGATPVNEGDVGLELVFELRPATGQDLDPATVIELRTILRQQLALLGVDGRVIRHRDGKILVRVDVTTDAEGVAQALTATPLLEIVDTRGQTLSPGTTVRTSLSTASSAATPTTTSESDATDPVYTTIVSGADLSDVRLLNDPATGQPVIGFTLDAEASKRFSDYASTHIGQPMAIILDKRVLSSPTIASAISSEGIIAGVPEQDVRLLATQLKISTLGVPLVLVEQRIVPAVVTPARPDAT
jgi:preprotein translocase subunit SecD